MSRNVQYFPDGKGRFIGRYTETAKTGDTILSFPNRAGIPTSGGRVGDTIIYHHNGRGGYLGARSISRCTKFGPAWGVNGSGQLGDGTTKTRWTPTLPGPHTWKMVSAGANHSLGIRSDGKLFSWGNDSYGKASAGLVSDYDGRCINQIGNDTWDWVAAGGSHSLAINSEGYLFAWGANNRGQLGIGPLYNSHSAFEPMTQVGSDTWSMVSAGVSYSAGIRTDERLCTWGISYHGVLGCEAYDPTWTAHWALPFEIEWFTHAPGHDYRCKFVACDTSAFRILVIRRDGMLFSAGEHYYGEMDYGFGFAFYPVERATMTKTWSYVDQGNFHIIAIDTDGHLYARGLNSSGQLGDGTTTNRGSFVQIGSDEWSSVSAGGATSLGIRSDGELFSWGRYDNGFLGDGSTEDHLVPTRVGPDNWKRVSAGNGFALGILEEAEE